MVNVCSAASTIFELPGLLIAYMLIGLFMTLVFYAAANTLAELRRIEEEDRVGVIFTM